MDNVSMIDQLPDEEEPTMLIPLGKRGWDDQRAGDCTTLVMDGDFDFLRVVAQVELQRSVSLPVGVPVRISQHFSRGYFYFRRVFLSTARQPDKLRHKSPDRSEERGVGTKVNGRRSLHNFLFPRGLQR